MNADKLALIDQYYHDNYYQYSDSAHGIDHVRDVYSTALCLNERLCLGLNIEYVTLAVYIHDIFSTTNRVNHHILAKTYVLNRTDRWLTTVPQQALVVIAQAVYDHRASVVVNNQHLNPYSLVLRMADRGVPCLNKCINRAYKFASIGKTDSLEVATSTLEHVNKKYGIHGYGVQDLLYRRIYSKELKRFWQDLKLLDPAAVLDMVTV